MAEHHRAERSRRLRSSIIVALLTKPLAALIPIISIWLFRPYLERERFGLYASVGSVGSILALSNIGMGLGLMNRLTGCYVSGDQALARRYVSTLTLAVAGIAATVMLLFTLAVPLLPWGWILGIPPGHAVALAQAPWAVWLVGLFTMAGMVLGMPLVVYTAYQELFRYNLWDAAAKLVMLAACVAVVYTRWGLLGVIVASVGSPVLVRLVNAGFLIGYEKPWVRPRFGDFDAALLHEVFFDGLWFCLLQASTLALFTLDRLIVANRLGAGVAGDYTIVGTVFLSAYGVYNLVLTPLWPAYGEAIHRGDLPWVKRHMTGSLALGCGGMLVCGLILWSSLGPRVIRLMAHGQAVNYTPNLIAAMTAMFVVWIWMAAQSIVLNAAGAIKFQLMILGGQALLNLPLAFLAARHFGAAGVAWSVALTGVVTGFWAYPWALNRHFHKSA